MKTKIRTEHLLTGAIILFVLVAIAPYFNVSGSGVKDVSCSDSDGEDYYTPGKVTTGYEHKSFSETWVYADECTDDKITEYVCLENKQKKIEYKCPYGCSNSACIRSICTDSDGGKDYYINGVAVFEGKLDETEKDYCLSASKLKEYFCASQEEIRAVEYVCQYGCENGVCLSSSGGQTCKDTDGMDYFRKGRITNSNGNVQIDYCAGTRVVEYSCSDKNLATSQYYACINGCSDGACVS